MTFIYVCLILAAAALMLWLLFMAIDNWDYLIGKVYSAATFLVAAALMTAAIEYENQNPCVKYEVKSRYDAALKMARPMKVCVERGEWVKD